MNKNRYISKRKKRRSRRGPPGIIERGPPNMMDLSVMPDTRSDQLPITQSELLIPEKVREPEKVNDKPANAGKDLSNEIGRILWDIGRPHFRVVVALGFSAALTVLSRRLIQEHLTLWGSLTGFFAFSSVVWLAIECLQDLTGIPIRDWIRDKATSWLNTR